MVFRCRVCQERARGDGSCKNPKCSESRLCQRGSHWKLKRRPCQPVTTLAVAGRPVAAAAGAHAPLRRMRGKKPVASEANKAAAPARVAHAACAAVAVAHTAVDQETRPDHQETRPDHPKTRPDLSNATVAAPAAVAAQPKAAWATPAPAAAAAAPR